MNNKYTYFIEYLSKDVSPMGTKFHSMVGSDNCKIKDMRNRLDDFLSDNKLSIKGTGKSGAVLDASGKMIGKYILNSRKLGV